MTAWLSDTQNIRNPSLSCGDLYQPSSLKATTRKGVVPGIFVYVMSYVRLTEELKTSNLA